MVKRLKITIEDSDDLGFVKECLFAGAISMAEFNDWITLLIADHDDLPTFVFDLIDLQEEDRAKLGNWRTFRGFVPSWKATSGQTAAVDGIGFARNARFESEMFGRDEALAALARHPEIADRFRETFPFIDVQL